MRSKSISGITVATFIMFLVIKSSVSLSGEALAPKSESAVSSTGLPSVGGPVEGGEQSRNNPLSWVGKKFVILPLKKTFQQNGYFGLSLYPENFDGTKDETLGTSLGFLRYDRFTGHTLTVVKVTDATDSALPGEVDIEFRDDELDVPVYTSDVGERFIMGLAPADELGMVRKSWVGKTVWSLVRELNQYDADTGKSTEIVIPRGDPLKVVNAVWGDASDDPVWLIVKTADGQTGYYEVAASPVNKMGPITKPIFEVNPRGDWPQKIWDKVRRGIVDIGMTENQVEFAIDYPKSKNKDTYPSGATEQWVYPNQYVYFTKGKVVAVQTIGL